MSDKSNARQIIEMLESELDKHEAAIEKAEEIGCSDSRIRADSRAFAIATVINKAMEIDKEGEAKATKSDRELESMDLENEDAAECVGCLDCGVTFKESEVLSSPDGTEHSCYPCARKACEGEE